MTADRPPGEIRPRDRVITSGRRREIGYVVSIDGDTAQVMFAGCGDKTWPVPLVKLVRHWDVRRVCSKLGRGPFRVEAKHPLYGFLPRGWIRSIEVDGHSIRWSMQDYDYYDLPDVVGDYVAAERALLEATAVLDEPLPFEEIASLPAHTEA